MDTERDAAEFVSELSIDRIPDDVRQRACIVIADSVGAIIGGSTTPYIASFGKNSAGRGEASILGTDRRTSTLRAAVVNGSAGTVLEIDEGHKYSAGHPAMHVLPGLLACAETDDGHGENLLTAFIAGYEVCARVGMACNPLDPVYHMHGVWGTVGAAAGIANYRNLNAADTLTAMRIGANHALHTRFDAATEGATVRNTYAGMSATNGVLAVDQAVAGISGLEDGIARHLERMCKDGFRREIVSESLYDRWEVTRGYFKNHAACRYTHGALDAVDALANREPLDPEAITTISVETYPSAARLSKQEPINELQAKFSIPFAVATRIVHGHSGKEAFSADALRKESYDLSRRITVESAPDLADRVPEARGTRMSVKLSNGRTLSEEVLRPKGDEKNPFTVQEIHDKFLTLTEPVLDSEAERLWEQSMNLADVSVSSLCDSARST